MSPRIAPPQAVDVGGREAPKLAALVGLWRTRPHGLGYIHPMQRDATPTAPIQDLVIAPVAARA